MTQKPRTKSSKKSRFSSVAAPVGGVLMTLFVIFLFNAQYYTAQLIYYFNPPKASTSFTKVVEAAKKHEEAKKVAPEPKVIIPGITVDAPVIYGMDSVNEGDVQFALRSGVLHFAGTPNPGQPGNGVYIGHSSGAPWAAGNYKFVFTALEHTQINDVFYLNHEGKQYVYQVIDKKIVSPYDVSVLMGDDTPTATLITCTPVGTSTNRLVIRGKQIHPAPVAGNVTQTATRPAVLPGN